jgi:metal-responsive CopG/Arc/MetJ family transcriptional regulator
MGRPPLKRNVDTVVTTIRLTATVAARIDAIAGPNKRSDFIREAVEKELKRREREVK